MMTLPAPGQIHRSLGGQIEVRVEIDTGLAGSTFMLWDVGEWDVDTWGSVDPDWADITDFVESVEIRQGTERWGDRFETGSATMTLDNTDGRFTPESGFSPFHLPFRPRRRLRVVAIPDPDDPLGKEPQFTGFIDSISPVFDDGGYLITVQLNCLDFMALWGGHDPVALETPTGVQDTHDRVGSALDRMDWPDDVDHRDIQTGEHTMQSSHLAQTTLEECARAAEAEGGHFYCSKDGKATFKARDWLSSDTRSIEVQGYLGFDEIPSGANPGHVVSVEPSWETDRIINLVEFARVGSEMQVVEDEASQGIFDIRSYQRTDLENNSDAEVLFLATRYLGQFNTDRMRIDSITIDAVADPDNEDLNRLMWDSQFGDLLSIKVQTPYGWELKKLVKIMGISHRISSEDWEVTFKLDDVFIFVGGSEMEISLSFEGAGENFDRFGGSEMALAIDFEGVGAVTSKSGGSEMSIGISMEGAGFKDRAELMSVLAPEAWWRFGAGSVDITTDSSGNGHTLTWSGSPSNGSGTSPLGSDRWVVLDGTNDMAVPADFADFLIDTISIEGWFRPGSGGGTIVQASDNDSSVTDSLYRFRYETVLGFQIFSEGMSTSAERGASADEWHHVVFTLDAVGEVARLYVDGVVDPDVDYFGMGTTPTLFRIGNLVQAVFGHVDDFFDGDISELTIFDRVLTADEVQELYESTYG